MACAVIRVGDGSAARWPGGAPERPRARHGALVGQKCLALKRLALSNQGSRYAHRAVLQPKACFCVVLAEGTFGFVGPPMISLASLGAVSNGHAWATIVPFLDDTTVLVFLVVIFPTVVTYLFVKDND